MAASKQNPTYTVYLISGNQKYNVTPALVSIDRTESEKQIAQRVTLQLMNMKVNGTWLSSIFQARNRVYIYANDGSKKEEVFRGFVWSRTYKSSNSDRELKYVCYDNLIYMQESEESLYFSAGQSTSAVFASICKKWEIALKYTYDSITHSKLPLRGNLYDIFTDDLLELVRKRTGNKYVILSEKDKKNPTLAEAKMVF